MFCAKVVAEPIGAPRVLCADLNRRENKMKKIITSVVAAAVALSSLAAAMPANAASTMTGAQVAPVAQHYMDRNHHEPKFERHGNYAYFNGHRGDRHRHPGWRYYNGYYFPPAAFVGLFIGGAILGGILNNAR
jgi:hypothetical protein